MLGDDRVLNGLRYGLVLLLVLFVIAPMSGQTGPAQTTGQITSHPQDKPSPVTATEKPANAAQLEQNSLQEEPRKPSAKANTSSNDAQERLSAEAMESFQSQMRELQNEADQFGARARITQEALRSIRAQMADQGLDLRSDVRDAESHMNYLLSKAHEDILRGDAFGAEADLKMAAYAADFIERFLGR